jgi:hypothetical protein
LSRSSGFTRSARRTSSRLLTCRRPGSLAGTSNVERWTAEQGCQRVVQRRFERVGARLERRLPEEQNLAAFHRLELPARAGQAVGLAGLAHDLAVGVHNPRKNREVGPELPVCA